VSDDRDDDDDQQDDPPPHVHQVRSWQKVGRDRVGYCACLEECARLVDHYET
jgi:hypothetical protein